jgi:hypothetical protein
MNHSQQINYMTSTRHVETYSIAVQAMSTIDAYSIEDIKIYSVLIVDVDYTARKKFQIS